MSTTVPTPKHTQSLVLTVEEVAATLNCAPTYVLELLERGEISSHQIGSQRRVPLREVIAYKARSDAERLAALDELARLGQEMGIGYET